MNACPALCFMVHGDVCYWGRYEASILEVDPARQAQPPLGCYLGHSEHLDLQHLLQVILRAADVDALVKQANTHTLFESDLDSRVLLPSHLLCVCTFSINSKASMVASTVGAILTSRLAKNP